MQFTFLLICHSFWFIFTIFPSYMYGQEVQFCPHFNMPLKFLLGYLFWLSGNFAFIKFSLRSFCLLNAISGGPLNTFDRYISLLVRDLQYIHCIHWIFSASKCKNVYYVFQMISNFLGIFCSVPENALREISCFTQLSRQFYCCNILYRVFFSPQKEVMNRFIDIY